MTSIPIVFIHYGNHNFLKCSIEQAYSKNSKSELFLIGDSANENLSKLTTHILISRYEECDKQFSRFYLHHSTNSFEYEYFCFKRWFLLYAFMEEKNFEWAFTLDSDVMVYNSIQSYFQENIFNNHYSSGLCMPLQDHDSFRWEASGHSAFVSKSFLKQFCDFVIDTYKNNFVLLQPKISYHIEKNSPGGICDMTLLYLFYQRTPKSIFNLLVPTSQRKVFDYAFPLSLNLKKDEFPIVRGFKNVIIQNRIPYAFNSKSEKFSFVTLHFHGSAKGRMWQFYTGRLNREIIILKALRFKSFIRHICGGVTKRVKRVINRSRRSLQLREKLLRRLKHH